MASLFSKKGNEFSAAAEGGWTNEKITTEKLFKSKPLRPAATSP